MLTTKGCIKRAEKAITTSEIYFLKMPINALDIPLEVPSGHQCATSKLAQPLFWLLQIVYNIKTSVATSSKDFPRPDLGPNIGPYPIQK